MCEGDTLYIESISRLGRSIKGLLNIIDTLTAKGVTLISHKEKIDTDTPAGNFMLTVFAALSQLEREQLKQRQREGIDATKNKGKHLGRPSTSLPDNWEEVLALWQAGKITAREAMRRTGMKRTTFYRLVHKSN